MSPTDERALRDGETLPLTPGQLALAVLGHLLIGFLLIVGVQCSHKPPEPAVIEAVLIAEPVTGAKTQPVPEPVKPLPTPTPPPPPPPKPKPPEPKPPTPTPPPPTPPPPKPEPPKPDPEKLKADAQAAEKKRVEDLAKVEQQQLLAKQQAEEKARQAEEKAKADVEKAKTEADAKAKRDAEEAQRKAAEDQARQAAIVAEQKRLADIEDTKRKAAEAAENQRKAEEKARTDALAKQLAAEEAARAAAARKIVQKTWTGIIGELIGRNWLLPPGESENFVCKLALHLAPNGVVLNAKIVTSCGSQILDDSVVKAAYKSSPLPLPSDPTAFDPDLILNFDPHRLVRH